MDEVVEEVLVQEVVVVQIIETVLGKGGRNADLSQGAAVFNNPTALQHQS